MRGMILAAGYGTRFRPATYQVPKPMVPVCNKPLIAYAADSLIAAGIREVVVNLHHLPEQIEDYLREAYAGQCSFIFSFEPEILGTGGGIRKVRHVLEKDEVFYLLNGDTIQRPPLQDLLRALQVSQSVASLLLRHAPANDRFTPVMFDGRVVTGFGKGRGQALMFAGAHAVSRRIFDYLPERDFSGLTEDVYAPLVEGGAETIAGTIYDDLWFDIGTPQRYLAASHAIRELIVSGRLPAPFGTLTDRRSHSLLGGNAQGGGDVSRSVLGNHCEVAEGAQVRDSIFWDGVAVATDARVDSSVLSHGVRVTAGGEIENALVCRVEEGIDYDSTMTFVGDLVATAVDRSKPLVLRGS